MGVISTLARGFSRMTAAGLAVAAALLCAGAATGAEQPAGTRKMVDRLAALQKTVDPREVIYLSGARAEMLAGALAGATNLQQELKLRVQLATELVQAGRAAQGLDEFKLIEDKLRAAGGAVSGRGAQDMRMRKAMAFMRLGEQINCVSNHNQDSCLLPIRGGGVHKYPEGSRSAASLFTEELGQNPDNLVARWLLNIAYMTLGEYPDKVPASFLVPPSVFASEYEMPRFPDAAASTGLGVNNLAGGVILDDFDNDGLIDAVMSDWSLTGQLKYFHNDGNGRFTDRTVEAGLKGLYGGLNIQQTDYNNDGLLDIWVMRGAWFAKEGRMPSNLLRNNGDGTFTDVTEEAGLLRFHPTQTARWFDYDGDGFLDLFIGNESLDPSDPDFCELFHNNGNGTFTECSAACGLRIATFVKGVACADYDNDGRPDLYLSVSGGENILIHNDGPADPAHPSGLKWRFSDAGKKAGVIDTSYTFPTWFFDYDNDGWEDLLVFGYHIANVGEIAADYLGLHNNAALPKLYHNNRDGTFTDVTASAHLNRVCHAMGCNYGDLDNDGWLDFYVGTGNPGLSTLVPNRMFRNAEGRFFQDVTVSTDTGNLQKGHGVAFADLDNDGDEDVFIVMGGAFDGDGFWNALYLNPGTTNHWVKLKLEGVKANRAAIGARVKVAARGPAGVREVHRTVSSGGSFGSNPLMQHVGLGSATVIERVEIVWPGSGLRQVVENVEADHAYKIREGEAATLMKLPQFKIDSSAAASGHMHHHGQ
jgi:ASPIC and UnbV/FG-GAP-like repeat